MLDMSSPISGPHSPSIRKALCLSFLFSRAPAARETWFQQLFTGGDPFCLESLQQGALFPYLYALLVERDCQKTVPPTLLEKLRNSYLCAVQQVVIQEAEAAQVVGGLAAAGIKVTLLKGADLRLRVYPDPATRPMIDLDLLVDRHDLARTRTVLQGLGYSTIEAHTNQRAGFRERFAPADIYEPPHGHVLKVDIHWGLWNEYSFYGLPLAPIKARAQDVSFQGVTVKVLAPEHLLIHLCLHAYWDGIMLRQLVDLILTAALLPMDWTRFQADASRWHCQAPLYQILSLTHQLSPEAVSSSAFAGLVGHRHSLAEKLVNTGALGPFTYYFSSLSRHPLHDWPDFLRAKLWPERGYLVAKFGSFSRGRYLGHFVRKFRNRARDTGNS
jgi:hypothetical protein